MLLGCINGKIAADISDYSVIQTISNSDNDETANVNY